MNFIKGKQKEKILRIKISVATQQTVGNSDYSKGYNYNIIRKKKTIASFNLDLVGNNNYKSYNIVRFPKLIRIMLINGGRILIFILNKYEDII